MTFNGLPPCPPHPDCPCSGPIDFELNANATPHCCTQCSGDIRDNIWFEPGAPGYIGRCIIDELTFEQVWLVLLRNPKAKKDLQRITSDPSLLMLANTTHLIVDTIEDDQIAAKRFSTGSIPMYTLFAGNFDGSIIGKIK